jgi:Aminopeptidase P, N-terminal domain
MLKANEVRPGVTLNEFQHRRARLAELLPTDSIAVVASAQTTYKAGVVPYPYRQSADFLYLTGSLQPGVAILHKHSEKGMVILLTCQPCPSLTPASVPAPMVYAKASLPSADSHANFRMAD